MRVIPLLPHIRTHSGGGGMHEIYPAGRDSFIKMPTAMTRPAMEQKHYKNLFLVFKMDFNL